MGVFRQFPYSNFHEMNMDEIIKIVKNMLEEWAQYHAEWDAWMTEINDDWSNYQEVMNEAWQNMQNFINNYFDNLDVQEEINNKIVSMVNSGEFADIVDPFIPPRVTAWLNTHITEPVGVVIDTSLSVAGACADAKATGDAIKNIDTHLNDSEERIFNELFLKDEALSIAQTINGYGLLANGRREANESYDIDIYNLTTNNISSGDLLYLKIADDTAGVYQFQKGDGGIPVNYDNADVVGGVRTSAVDGFVVVPDEALWLMVSRNSDRTDDEIRRTTNQIDNIENDITELNNKLSDSEERIYDELFVKGESLTIVQTINGYGLLANGGRTLDASDAIDIYNLTTNNISSGDLLYLKIADDTAGVYMFQKGDAGIPVDTANNQVVGGVQTTAVDGFVVVPDEALWLMVSRNSDRTDDEIRRKENRIDNIEEDITELNTIKDDFETHVFGENLVNTDGLEVGYYYLNGVKTAGASMTTAWINVEDISVINASGRKISDSEWSGVEMYYICSFDADKNYIANSMDNTGYRQYNVPNDAKYLTVSYVNITYDEFTVVAGTNRPVRYVQSVEKTILMPEHYGLWYGKTWSAMGDSLTEYNDKNDKNYIEFISEATGIKPTNLGVSGTGYMRGIENTTPNSFYNRINTIPTDTDVLTIFGSFNDIGGGQTLGTIDDDITDNTVFGYVNATLDGIYSAIPTINIGIIAPTPWKDNRPWDDNETGSKYVEGLKQICYNRGIPFLDLYHCSNLRPWDATARDEFYSNDIVDGVNAGCHPNTKGHKMIAPKIKAFLDMLVI